MRRFKKILGFVNGPESIVSLKRAINLPEENQDELLALDVLRPPSTLFQAFSGSDFADGLRREVVPQREEELRTMVADPGKRMHRMQEGQEEATAQALGTLLKPFDIDPSSPHVNLIKGAPGYVIPELVGKAQIELLVMGTVCRSGIPGVMIGNTAEQVLSDVDCSVLTLKPDGFKSPVTLTDRLKGIVEWPQGNGMCL